MVGPEVREAASGKACPNLFYKLNILLKEGI
jgi:hypothetical protein